MLHTKFQSNQPSSSEEKDFLWSLSYMDMAAILTKRPVPFEQIFNQILPGSCIWNLIQIGQAVSEEKSFENVNKHSILVTFGQSHWMTLAFGIHRSAWNTFFHITDYHCFRKLQCFTFFHPKAQGTKFDTDEKWVNVNLGSPFEQTWQYSVT